MTANVGKLKASLGLDSSRFKAGLRQSKGAAGAFAGQMRSIMIGLGASIGAALSVRAVRSTMDAIDAQAKLAASFGTTTESMQIMTRAGDLAGVSLGEIQQATIQLTRRLSQAANGGGPAAKVLERIHLAAAELQALPINERIAAIQNGLEQYAGAGERAALASELFGSRAGLIFSRIDAATLKQAAQDVRDFGVAVSEVDAVRIQTANDALSRLGLITTGIGNRIAAAVAPSLQSFADLMAALAREGGVVHRAIDGVVGNLDRLATYVGTVAALLSARLVASLALAAATTLSLSRALIILRGALIRTGIGALIVAAGELVYRFGRLIKGAGSFGEALTLLKGVGIGVFDKIRQAGSLLAEGLSAGAMQINAAFAGAFARVAENFSAMTGVLANGWNSLMGSLGLEGGAKALGSEVAASMRADADAMAASATALSNSVWQSFGDLGRPIEAWGKLKSVVQSGAKDVGSAVDAATGSVGRFNDAVEGSGGSGGGSVGKVRKEADRTKDQFSQLRDASKAFFASVVTGTASAKDALKELAGRLSDLLANQAFDLIFSKNVLGGGKTGGGLFGKLIGSLIPKHAAGTNNSRGGLAMVGELGRELVNLPRGSQVVPHHKTERMMRGLNSGGVLRVYLDDSLSLRAEMQREAQGVAVEVVKQAAPAIQSGAVQKVSRMSHKTKRFMGG